MQETEITVQVFESKEIIDKKLKYLRYKIIENFQLNDFVTSQIKFKKFTNTPNFIYNSYILCYNSCAN